ncbi:MAG: hypothetical protein VW102_04015 [Poseidonia sp.]|jgi:hypothetical protein
MSEEVSELMMAAIAAVMAATQHDGEDASQVARRPGAPWSQDHRRQMTGQPSLMRARSGRSPWR